MNIFILQPEVLRENKANLRVNSSPIVSKFTQLALKIAADDRFIIRSSGSVLSSDEFLSLISVMLA